MALQGGEPVLAAAGPWFEDAVAQWNVQFTHRHGGRGDFFMSETMGSGVVVFDYDADGDDDVLFLDSGDPEVYRAAHAEGSWRPGRSVLLRNDLVPATKEQPGATRPRFVDVSSRAGIGELGYAMGATAGDVDGDGDLDVVVTSFGPTHLLRNDGVGGFSRELVDAPEPYSGASTTELAERRRRQVHWGMSAALADADLDGDLDLYVTHYVDFDYDNNHLCGEPERQLRSYCHPNEYLGLADRYYENDGAGAFSDRSDAFGIPGSAAQGNGLGVVWLDLGADSLPDLYVANDMTANALFRHPGLRHGGPAEGRLAGTFEEVGALAGVALSDRGQAEAGMGIAAGDWDGNGLEDLLVTHLDRQTNALYSALSAGLFVDQRFQARLAEASVPRVGFGAAFDDFDLDGDLDLVVANGHIIHNVEEYERGTTFRQPNDLYEQTAGQGYRTVAASGLAVVRSSRGLALADFDLDGRSDVVISNSNEAAEAYRNAHASSGGAALRVRLRDLELLERGGSGEAVGAWLRLTLAGKGAPPPQSRYVRTGTSYLSQSSLEQGFALVGKAQAGATEAKLEITWPDGARQRIAVPGGVTDRPERWLVVRSAAPTALEPGRVQGGAP